MRMSADYFELLKSAQSAFIRGFFCLKIERDFGDFLHLSLQSLKPKKTRTINARVFFCSVLSRSKLFGVAGFFRFGRFRLSGFFRFRRFGFRFRFGGRVEH